MESNDLYFGADEHCVLQYLHNFPDQFLTEVEIARRADGREHFMEDPHWAHNALGRLLELKLVEMDEWGKYHLTLGKPKASEVTKRFIDPKLRQLLEQSRRKIDLSRFE